MGASHSKLPLCQVWWPQNCSGKDMFLICHVISQGRVTQEPCDFIDKGLLRKVTSRPCLVTIDTAVMDIY